MGNYRKNYQGFKCRIIIIQKDALVRVNYDIGRIINYNLFYGVRKNILHIDNRRKPEPELQENPHCFLEVSDKYGQGSGKEPKAKSK